jgi:hypothetical protein
MIWRPSRAWAKNRRSQAGAWERDKKTYEYSCHSERSAASLRISAALKERFFAALRMTKKSLLIAH